MSNIPIRDIPGSIGTPTEDALVAMDNGVTMQKTTARAIAEAGRPAASKAEAEAGEDNRKVMTPLRVAEAIAAQTISPAEVQTVYEARDATLNAADAASSSAGTAVGAAGTAQTSAGQAMAFRNSAEGFRNAAEGFATNAGNAADRAEEAVSDAEAQVTLATSEADRSEAAATVSSGLASAFIIAENTFATKATAEAWHPSAAPDYIRIAGNQHANDGGGFLAARVTTEPSHEGKLSITLGDGSTSVWYEIVPEQGTVGTTAFGAAPDNDISDAIQRAINFAMYGSPIGRSKGIGTLIDVPSGAVSKTIHLGYGTSFKGGILRGMGLKYHGESLNAGTVLNSSVLDAPTVSIQGARFSKLTDLSIEGPAVAGLSFGGSANWREGINEAAWDAALVAAGVTPGRRYAPQVAVAVDPYSGTRRSPSYPDVDYPDFLGTVVQYGKSNSSDVTIDAHIRGFEVAVAVQPSDTDGNGDFVTIKGIIKNCKYGISIGNSQARLTDFSKVSFANVHTCVTNWKHGRQIGKVAATLVNVDGAGFIYQIFDFGNLAYAGNVTFLSPYFESLFRIGSIGAAVSDTSTLRISEGYINLLARDAGRIAVAGSLIAGTGGYNSILIENTRIAPDRISSFTPHINVDLRGSENALRTPAAKPYEAMCLNTLCGGFALNGIANRPLEGVRYRPVNTTTMARQTAELTSPTFNKTGRNYGVPHNIIAASCEIMGSWSGKRISSVIVTAANRQGQVRDGLTISYTNPQVANNDNDFLSGRLPGCVLVHNESGTVMFIRSVDRSTGATVVELQNNYITDELGTDVIDSTFLTGTWYAFSGLVYSPPRMLRGDITQGSNIITNVRSAGGVNETNFGLQVGDLLAGACYEEFPFTGSNALTITGIDVSARTITLAGNSQITRTGYPFPWWYRQPPANESSR